MATSCDEKTKFLLRLPASLHERLRLEASRRESSLNSLLLERLSKNETDHPGGKEPNSPFDSFVRELQGSFGAGLLGVAIFGSYARGEAHSHSDLDVLVVLDDAEKLGPALNRKWDDQDRELNGHAVQAEFVRFPRRESGVTGFWAEIALDGIVLFDPEYLLSRALSAIRRHIASGRMLRRMVHGQHYWVHNEDEGAA